MNNCDRSFEQSVDYSHMNVIPFLPLPENVFQLNLPVGPDTANLQTSL